MINNSTQPERHTMININPAASDLAAGQVYRLFKHGVDQRVDVTLLHYWRNGYWIVREHNFQTTVAAGASELVIKSS